MPTQPLGPRRGDEAWPAGAGRHDVSPGAPAGSGEPGTLSQIGFPLQPRAVSPGVGVDARVDGAGTEQRGLDVPAQRTPAEGPLAAPGLTNGGGPAPADDDGRAAPGAESEQAGAGERSPNGDADPARLGAHAAPYMDPDGTLHNLRPIGRLAVSGPDAPQRVAETSFGGMWFSRPTGEGAGPAGELSQNGDGPVEPSAGADQQDAGTGQHGQPPATGQAGSAGTQHEQQRTQHEQQPEALSEQGDGQVIDLDLSALFQGVTITGEQPAVKDEAPGGAEPVDAASVRATIDERMAAPRMPRELRTEPVKERPALSAADLEAIRWRLDGGTLREVVDDREALRELGERLDGPLADEVDNVAKAGLLSVRAEVYRLLGELGMAAAASRLALAHAESARDMQSEVIAQAELAHILRLRGDFKEADRLFAKATGSEVPETLRSVVHENAGRSCFDQGRHMEALDHFARAVRLGRPEDTDLAARVGVCLEAVYIHVLRDGWGPYPRTREDILGLRNALEESTAEQPVIPPR